MWTQGDNLGLFELRMKGELGNFMDHTEAISLRSRAEPKDNAPGTLPSVFMYGERSILISYYHILFQVLHLMASVY